VIARSQYEEYSKARQSKAAALRLPCSLARDPRHATRQPRCNPPSISLNNFAKALPLTPARKTRTQTFSSHLIRTRSFTPRSASMTSLASWHNSIPPKQPTRHSLASHESEATILYFNPTYSSKFRLNHD